MTLGRRMGVLVGVYLALVAAASVVVLPLVLGVRSSAAREDGVLRVAEEASRRVATGSVDRETGLRGYVITGDPVFLEPWDRGGVMVEEGLADLRRLAAGGEIQRLGPVVEAVEDHYRTWLRDSAERELAAVTAGRRDEAARLVATGVGKRNFDELRADLGSLDALLALERDAVREELGDALDALAVALGVVLALGVATAVLARRLLRRWVTAPARALLDLVQAVTAQGQGEPVQVEGPTEFVTIAAGVEAMRGRLLGALGRAETARQGLAQRGPVVLMLREELEPDVGRLPEGLAVAGRVEPAEGLLAGDFWDMVPLVGGGRALVVADVSGHGPVAGVLAVRFKYLVAAALQLGMTPGDALHWSSERLGDTDGAFVSAIVVAVHPATGEALWANAGHPPALAIVEGEVLTLRRTGPVVGPLRTTWGSEPLDLRRGGTVLAYTDGVTEARGPSGAMFGEDRLLGLVRDHADAPPETLVDLLATAVHAHVQGPPSDDVTLAALAVLPVDAVSPRSTDDAEVSSSGPAGVRPARR